MSNSRSQYSEKGTGNRYDPRTRKEVTSTQLPAHRSRTEGSQTGTDEVTFDFDSVTSEDRNKQKVILEEIERRYQANQQHGQSSNNGTVPIRSASTKFRENPNLATIRSQQPNSNDSNNTGLGHNHSGASRACAGQSGRAYSFKGTGNRYDPRTEAQVTPTQLPAHSANQATIGSQQPNSNGSNNPGLGHNQSGASRAPAGQRRQMGNTPSAVGSSGDMLDDAENDSKDQNNSSVGGRDDSKPVDMSEEQSGPAPGPPNGSNNGEKEDSLGNSGADGGTLNSPDHGWTLSKAAVKSSWNFFMEKLNNQATQDHRTNGDCSQEDACGKPINTEGGDRSKSAESGGQAVVPESLNTEVAIQKNDPSSSPWWGFGEYLPSGVTKKRHDFVGREPIQCIVCDDEMATVKFQPCGHRIACPQCSARMKKCMSCQVAIKRKIDAEGLDVVAGDVIIHKEMVKKNQELEDTFTCAICLDRRRNMVFLCGHSACQECAQSLQQCHMCREVITKRINTFT